MNNLLMRVVHPLWLRGTHWINALAVFVMTTSGWQIYNASPLFDFRFPPQVTLGGWLGGGLLWHFAAMWLLGINGVIYLFLSFASRRFTSKFFPVTLSGFREDLKAAMGGHLAHDIAHYNHVQKTAYLFVIADIIVLVLSGLAIWKSVQFPLLRVFFGGYDTARYVHFGAMSLLIAFVAVHLVMVALVPRTLLAMIRGR